MYGSKIYRSDGKVWMSPSLSPIVFQRKQVVSLSGGTEFNTKISPDRSPIIFVAYSKAVSLIANRIVRNNQVIYSFGGQGSDSSATIYVFSKGIAKKETWGMSFFNAQGGKSIIRQISHFHLPFLIIRSGTALEGMFLITLQR